MIQERDIREQLLEIDGLLEDGALSTEGRIAANATKSTICWVLGELADLSFMTTALPPGKGR